MAQQLAKYLTEEVDKKMRSGNMMEQAYWDECVSQLYEGAMSINGTHSMASKRKIVFLWQFRFERHQG